jgi:hypothetical protein
VIQLIFVNIEIFQVVSAVFIENFQHNQQYDTLLPVIPCTHKLQAGIA